jgi:hypothetical protein
MDTDRRGFLKAGWLFICIFLSFSATFVACTPPSTEAATPTTFSPFSSASLPVTKVTQQTATAPSPNPTATATCRNNLDFIKDLTVPDNTLVQPNRTIDKQWQVKNSGTCNWDSSYHIKLVGGDSLGVQTEQALYPARAGAQITLRIIFTAPQEPGIYSSTWQAFDPQGQPFGDKFYVQVMVK